MSDVILNYQIFNYFFVNNYKKPKKKNKKIKISSYGFIAMTSPTPAVT